MNIEYVTILVAVIKPAWLISLHHHALLIHIILPDLQMSSPLVTALPHWWLLDQILILKKLRC